MTRHIGVKDSDLQSSTIVQRTRASRSGRRSTTQRQISIRAFAQMLFLSAMTKRAVKQMWLSLID